MARTKIICTIGPASSQTTVLRKMMLAGMDVVRLNCSHGSERGRREKIETIRVLNRKYRRRVRILLDLEGHRVRVGRFRSGAGMPLKKGQKVRLAKGETSKARDVIPFDYEGPLSDIKKGRHIFIDDGNICLRVVGRRGAFVLALVEVPGLVKQHKGINIPGAKLSFKGLTDRDKADILFGVVHGVDYIAQSFVRNRDDITCLRQFVRGACGSGAAPGLIAKIENRDGIKNIDSIIGAADGIMVARGDMGVSIPIYEVPMVQKKITSKCRKARRFVITATQMLESMTEHLRPTRAEVADVANAVLDGSDYVMLSGETAVGKYPVQTVKMMDDIVKYTERCSGR